MKFKRSSWMSKLIILLPAAAAVVTLVSLQAGLAEKRLGTVSFSAPQSSLCFLKGGTLSMLTQVLPNAARKSRTKAGYSPEK